MREEEAARVAEDEEGGEGGESVKGTCTIYSSQYCGAKTQSSKASLCGRGD